MRHDSRQLIRLVANATVVRNRDPATRSHGSQAILIAALRWEMIGVTLDTQSCFAEQRRKL